jgi:hypothetical protein
MSKSYRKWTDADIQFINDNKGLLDKEVAAKLSEATGQLISPSMIRRQRRKSGITKSRGRPAKNRQAIQEGVN